MLCLRFCCRADTHTRRFSLDSGLINGGNYSIIFVIHQATDNFIEAHGIDWLHHLAGNHLLEMPRSAFPEAYL